MSFLRPPNEADALYRSMNTPGRFLNEGVVNANGPLWHELRARLTPPLTNRAVLRHFVGGMNQVNNKSAYRNGISKKNLIFNHEFRRVI